MTYLEQAIKDAGTVGYKDISSIGAFVPGAKPAIYIHELATLYKERTLLDPAFWQALGKARGWGSYGVGTHSGFYPNEGWLVNWHALIDHLAADGTIEEFFKSL